MKQLFCLLLALAVVLMPVYAQDKPMGDEKKPADETKLQEIAVTDELPQESKVFHVKMDGVDVKVTISGSPKTMEKLYNKEVKIRQELVGIHQDVARIQQRVKNIYRELDIHCPWVEKLYEKCVQQNHKWLKKHQAQLEKCKHEHQAREKEKQAESLKKEVDKAVETPKVIMPETTPAPTEKKEIVPEKPAEVQPPTTIAPENIAPEKPAEQPAPENKSPEATKSAEAK